VSVLLLLGIKERGRRHSAKWRCGIDNGGRERRSRSGRSGLIKCEAASFARETRRAVLNQVTPKTPPAFVAHAKDDGVVIPDNTITFAKALQMQNLESPSGGHGLNRYKGEMRDAWQTQSLAWVSELMFIPADADKEK
jgi:hypothetical protein